MGKKGRAGKDPKPATLGESGESMGEALETAFSERKSAAAPKAGKPSSLLDTRVIYCGDCLEQLEKLPPACLDLIYIDPCCGEIELSFNSNRNYEFFWGGRPRPNEGSWVRWR